MGSSSSDINPQAFFQPLLPHFLSSFSIPSSFMKKVKGDEVVESVVLMMREREGNSKHKHWVIKIKGGQGFDSEDWKKFAVHYNLRVGDFLVFRHMGSFLFHVSVFDPLTACDSNHLKEEEEEEAKREGNGVRRSSSGTVQRPVPSYTFTLTSYFADKCTVYLSKKFVREIGLAYTSCDVILVDEKKRSWEMKLHYKKGDGQPYINRGWKSLQEGNRLRPGDVIRLQLLNAGKLPVFKCCSEHMGRKFN